MLTIVVPLSEGINDNNEFVTAESFTLQMEHSLASLSKWESKFEIPYLSSEKTTEQVMWYVKEAMTLTPDVPDVVFSSFSKENVKAIEDYISAKMTATWFPKGKSSKQNQEIITSEIIYYWMITCGIPVEFERWHLNRLLTLIEVCFRKNAPPKKMTPQEIYQQNMELNRRRRAATGSSG